MPNIPVDFKYHANLILNEDGQAADVALAQSFCEEFLRRFRNETFKVFYPPYDMLGGADYFTSLLESLENSLYTVIVLTPGFVKSGWNVFCQRSALKIKLSQEPGRYLPLGVGISKQDVPKELSIFKVIFFEHDFNSPSSNQSWNMVQKSLRISGEGDARIQQWRVLRDEELMALSSQLGHEWQPLVLDLGLQYSKLEQIQASNQGNVVMQTFSALWHWRQYCEGDEMNKLDKLVAALLKVNRSELAETLHSKRGLIDEGPSAEAAL